MNDPPVRHPAFDFDIDTHLNRFVPRSRLYLLPKPISWFLGYRSSPQPRLGRLLINAWAGIGAFVGLIIVEAVFRTPTLQNHGSPVIIASFGASAILEYHAVDVPLSQPRNMILGQLFSSIIGVGITKLFRLNSNFEDLRWIAGALSVGCASTFMSLTDTVHPPGGASALIAATQAEITDLGWFLVPLILLANVLMLASACLLNNIQRQFPVYWWTASDLGKSAKHDVEKAANRSDKGSEKDIGDDLDKVSQEESHRCITQHVIFVTRNQILFPDWINLDDRERDVLEDLSVRLRKGLSAATSRDSEQTC